MHITVNGDDNNGCEDDGAEMYNDDSVSWDDVDADYGRMLLLVMIGG